MDVNHGATTKDDPSGELADRAQLRQDALTDSSAMLWTNRPARRCAARRAPGDRQYPPIKLACAFGAADHSGLLHIAKDRHVTRSGTGQRRHPMQRISPLENLQITGLQAQGPNQAADTVEHRLDTGIVLVGRRTQVWAVFEITTRLGILDRQLRWPVARARRRHR